MNKIPLIFRHRFKLRSFLLIALLFFLGVFMFRKIAGFLLISLIVMVITYFNYSFKLPFDITPVLFVSLILSREYNLVYSIIFLMIAGIIPMVLTGGSFDHTTLFYLSVRIIVNFINTYLLSFPAMPVLIIMAILDHLIGTIGSVSLFGANFSKEIINFLLQTIVDVIYITSFSALLIMLL
jgi:hypothetical protein